MTNKVPNNDDKLKVYQNCSFYDPWGSGSYARMWPYKSYNENALFLLESSFLHPGIDKTN